MVPPSTAVDGDPERVWMPCSYCPGGFWVDGEARPPVDGRGEAAGGPVFCSEACRRAYPGA
ncbi:hypothetical protein ACFQH6_03810 [Halobacteriaceae archaeon GCM10025711]